MLKLKSLACFVALLLLSICLPAQAQLKPAPARCNQSRDDISVVQSMPDVGADVALVVAPQGVIYERPAASSKVLLRAERGEALALVKRDPVRNWYRVIDVDSATEGWIDECAIIIKLTTNRQSGPPLEEESLGTEADPELNVSNMEPTTALNLRINDALYVIPANTTKTIILKPGRYEYYGYSPGVRPAFGSDNFAPGYRYRWTFKIVRR